MTSTARTTAPKQYDLNSKITLHPSLLRFWLYWLQFIVAIPVCAFVALKLEDAGMPTLTTNGVRIVAWLPIIFPIIILWKKYNVRYEFNENVISVTRGILSLYRSYAATDYKAVLAVDAKQSFMCMLLNVADLSIGTAESGVREFMLPGVRHWRYYLEVLKARVEQARSEKQAAVG